MRNLIIGVIAGGLAGTALGFVIGIFVYPYIFLADIVASEELVGAEEKTVVATGNFIHANPSDPIHYGSGSVTVSISGMPRRSVRNVIRWPSSATSRHESSSRVSWRMRSSRLQILEERPSFAREGSTFSTTSRNDSRRPLRSWISATSTTTT